MIQIETKLKIIRWTLAVMTVFLFVIGISHIFFPAESHKIIGQTAFDASHTWMLLAARVLGVYFLVIGITALIAILNPLQHKWLVFIVVLSSDLTDLLRASAINCPRLWLIMVISMILWLLIVIFYPYKEKPDLFFKKI